MNPDDEATTGFWQSIEAAAEALTTASPRSLSAMLTELVDLPSREVIPRLSAEETVWTRRPITLRVLEGSIQVSLADRTIQMTRGDLTALAPNLKHRVTGVDDAAILLTMGGAVSSTSPG